MNVNETIASVMEDFPGENAIYYKAVHQALAPLARDLERELAALRAATPSAPLVAVTDNWQPIETAPKGRKVLAAYQNKLGNWRRIIARYYAPGTLAAHEDADDDQCDDEGYAKEGWYEESETHEFIMPTDETPVFWMPLPAAPGADQASPQATAYDYTPEKLWMIHILGPDDIYAAPSMVDAYEQAAKLQRFMDSHTSKSEHMPTVTAVVVEWDSTAEAHAENLKNYWPDFAATEAQATVEPLTDEQIKEIYINTFESMPGCARSAPTNLAPLIYEFARALLAATPTASKATESADAEEIVFQHFALGQPHCAPMCKYFGDTGCECALMATSKADTGEIRNAVLEEAYHAADNVCPVDEEGNQRNPVKVRNDILNVLNALRSATPSTIKADHINDAVEMVTTIKVDERPLTIGDDDYVSVHRALIGSAIYAIDKKHDAPNTLRRLREIALSASLPIDSSDSEGVESAWNKFNEIVSDGPDSPYPGMAHAFEKYYSQKWTDRDWRNETSVWAAAWKEAVAAVLPQGEQTDSEEDAYLIKCLTTLLADVAITLKGPELPLHRHSYHDLPELVQKMKLELDLHRFQESERNAAISPQGGEAKPIYLVNSVSWRAVDKETFDLFPHYNRMIAYAAPAVVGEAKAVAPEPALIVELVDNGYSGKPHIRKWDNPGGLTGGLHHLYTAPVPRALPVVAEKDAPFTIEAKPDGVWLKFNGGAVCLNNIADKRGPIVKRAMHTAIAAMQGEKQ